MSTNHTIAKQLDLDHVILWGDRLRVLLNSHLISYGEINQILREKGIFIDSSDKNITVPLLSNCLLTPSEFSRLINRSYKRTSIEKYKTDKYPILSEDADWFGNIESNFDDIISGLLRDDSIQFIQNPRFFTNKNGDFEITYLIKKENLSKDWIEQELQFFGSLVISRRTKELIIDVLKTHTAKETEQINDTIIRGITKRLKDNNIIKDDKPQSIKFTDFDNTERVSFFLQLTGSSAKDFSFQELVDMEIIRDSSAGALPANPSIQWMDGGIKRIRINGEQLDKFVILQNKEFHRFCFLAKMSAVYEFKIGGETGQCTIVFWFGGKNSTDKDLENSELNFSIDKLSIRLNKDAERSIRRAILKLIWNLQESALILITDQRSKKIAA